MNDNMSSSPFEGADPIANLAAITSLKDPKIQTIVDRLSQQMAEAVARNVDAILQAVSGLDTSAAEAINRLEKRASDAEKKLFEVRTAASDVSTWARSYMAADTVTTDPELRGKTFYQLTLALARLEEAMRESDK